MDGADASTTFTDESAKTWTARGNAQIDTAQSVFGGASGLFDGTGDYIDTPDSADWQLDGGSNANKWTIDFRVRFNGDPGTGGVGFVAQIADSTLDFWAFELGNNALNFWSRVGGTNVILISNAWNPASATWYHVAVVKDGTNGYMMFVDGTQVGSTQTDTSTLANFAVALTVGSFTLAATAFALNGWMDEFRISKGIARWTANFTPPTTEYILDPDHAMPAWAIVSSGIAFDLSWDMAFPAGVVLLNGPTPVYAWLWSMTVGVITLAGQAFIRGVSHLHRIFFGLSPTSDIITGAAPTGTIHAAAAPTEDIEFPKE